MGYRLPDRDLALCYSRRDAGATGHNARERDTGERRAAGGGNGGTRGIGAATPALPLPTTLIHHVSVLSLSPVAGKHFPIIQCFDFT
jgi:hypothetical protein